MRRVRVIVLHVALVALAAAVPSAGALRAAPCWLPPVAAPVIDPYRAPGCPWCPGNRGITYGTAVGQDVTSVAAGRVTFAGPVAGTVYLVVEVAGGWRITYGNLAGVGLAAGDAVVAGMVVGSAAGPLHFGLRAAPPPGTAPGDAAYLDPTPYLGRWRYRPRLIPLGVEAPPAPAPTLVCGSSPAPASGSLASRFIAR